MDREPDADHTLVELLYGELDGPARDRAEARAAADPALATELDGLRALRGTLRSWGEATDAEPPGDVSALLAAARSSARPVAVATEASAPGLWERLARWMAPLMAHPGLAAAATLVVVVGVAGTLYVTGGPQMAEMTAAPARSQEEVATGTAAAPEPAPVAPAEPAPAPAVIAEEAAPRAASGAAADESRQRVETKGGAAEKTRARRRDKAEPLGGVEGGVEGGSLEADEAFEAPEREEAAKPAPPAKATAPAKPTAPTKDDVARQAPAPTSAPSSAPPPPPPAAPAPADRADTAEPSAQSDDLARLTRDARAAAARADCARVRAISARVRSIDAAYHERTFRGDKAIAACLAAKKL